MAKLIKSLFKTRQKSHSTRAHADGRYKEPELQLILSQTPFMLTRCSADLRYRFVSPAYAEMLGRPAAEITGKPIIDIIGEEGFKIILPHIQKVLKGEIVEYERQVAFRNVGLRTLHVIYCPETNPQGEIMGWIGSIRDLTDTKRAEESLAESRRREQVLFRFVDRLHHADSEAMVYEAALDAIVDGLRCDRTSILLFDEAGTMRFVAARGLSNEYMRAVEGHSPWRADDSDAQPISITDIATAELDEHLRTVITKEGIQALHFIPLITGARLIGKFMVYFNKPRVCSTEELELGVNIARQFAFSIAKQQVEAEKEALAAREYKLRQIAEESNRLKDEFLAIMSHELRNPLNVIVGYSELLVRLKEIADSPGILKMTEAIRRNAKTQAKLVQDVVDLSRLRSGKLELNREVVSVVTCVNGAIDTVREDADGKKIGIAISVLDESVLVNADPIRLQQIVWNLLNNSVKFTPDGGTIAVSITVSDDHVILTVQDDGQGIDPSFLPHVFEIFRQADTGTTRAQSGMGVGLAVVKQLVELHGGTVSVASDGPGHGSRFTVTLPLSKQAASVPIGSRNREDLDNLRVLVLDDSEDTAEMLKTLLEASGASVVAASAGKEALRIADQSDFDVILSDISMPGMDGFEFVRKVKSSGRNSNVPIFALTGFGRPEDIQRARAAGFKGHLTKPLDFEFLIETLRNTPRE